MVEPGAAGRGGRAATAGGYSSGHPGDQLDAAGPAANPAARPALTLKAGPARAGRWLAHWSSARARWAWGGLALTLAVCAGACTTATLEPPPLPTLAVATIA